MAEPVGDSDTDADVEYEWEEDSEEDDSLEADYGGRRGHSAPVSGRKMVMYHGTTRRNAQSIQATGFRQSPSRMLGRGVYLSRDLKKASRYPIGHPESDKVVLKVLVDVGKVKAIDYQGHPLQKTWHDHGYDTAWVPPGCGMVKSSLEENCVWDPKRIHIIKAIKPRRVHNPRVAQGLRSLQSALGHGARGYM